MARQHEAISATPSQLADIDSRYDRIVKTAFETSPTPGHPGGYELGTCNPNGDTRSDLPARLVPQRPERR